MAAFRDFFIPSTVPGKTWRVSYYKPQRGPGVICASEGESELTDGIRIFKHALFSERRHRHELQGRATKRAVAQALCEVLIHLAACGSITDEDAHKWVTQAAAI